MAFIGHQSSSSNFHCFQGGVNQCGVNVGALPFEPVYVASPDQDNPSIASWPNDDHRNVSECVDWDGEQDLQGLVSSIVDDTDTQANFYNGGFPSSDVNHGELSQQLNAFAPGQQWLFNLPNGENQRPLRPTALPPGLPIPNRGNPHLPLQSKPDRSHFQELSDVLTSQSETDISSFDPLSEGLCARLDSKYFPREQQQNFNPLANSFVPLMSPDHSAALLRGSSSVQKQPAAGSLFHDPPWKTSSPAFPTKPHPAVLMPPPQGQEFGSILWEHNKGTRNQTMTQDAFQDVANFCKQNAEYFHQSKSRSASALPPNPYQNKMHQESNGVVDNSKHYMELSQRRSTPTQMDRRKALAEGAFQRRAQPNMKPGDEQHFSQPSFFNSQGPTPPQSFNGHNGVSSAANSNVQHLAHFLANVLRGHDVNFNHRFSLPNGGSVPTRSPLAMSNERPGAPGPYATNMNAWRRESLYHSNAPAGSALVNPRPAVQLQTYLEKCCDQWRNLVEEREKTEDFLLKTFMGQTTAAPENNVVLPKAPPQRQMKLDQLILNQMREQEKVTDVLGKIECLHSVSLHSNIHMALSRHQMAVCVLQARCTEETLSRTQQLTTAHTEAKDLVLLEIALKDLAATTRNLRTALWCSVQTAISSLPIKTPPTPDGAGEAAGATADRCPFPFQGYSFILPSNKYQLPALNKAPGRAARV